MSSDRVYDAVRNYLIDVWSATHLVFDNEDADQGGNARPQEGTAPWVLVEMTSNFDERASIGASGETAADDDNLFREEGQLLFSVMVPSGTGSRVARQLAKAIVNLFRRLELADGTIEFLTASIGVGQRQEEEGQWFIMPVSVDYRADEF